MQNLTALRIVLTQHNRSGTTKKSNLNAALFTVLIRFSH